MIYIKYLTLTIWQQLFFYICNLLLSQVIVHQNLFLNVLVINVNRQKFRLKVYMLFAGL